MKIFYGILAIDFNEDVVLMGHDGPGHIAIAEGKTKVRPLHIYHGRFGRGLSVEMSVLHGPVTLLSVVRTAQGKLKLLIAQANPFLAQFWKLAVRKLGTDFRWVCGALSTHGIRMDQRTTPPLEWGTWQAS